MNLLVKLLKPVVQKLPKLAGIYRRLRDVSMQQGKVEYQPRLGFMFAGPKTMTDGAFEPVETAIFDKLVVHSDLFINIGANIGYYVARALSKRIDAIAVEPNHLNVQLLLKNVTANRFTARCSVLPVALSESAGIVSFYGAGTGGSLVKGWAGQTNSRLVPVWRFDDIAVNLVRGKRCFVLIDVEGAELDCLRGAQGLFSETQSSVFLVEIATVAHQPDGTNLNPNLVETFRVFFSKGYRAFTADLSLREVFSGDVERVKNSGVDSIRCCNFLFFPPDSGPSDFGLFGSSVN